MRKITPRPFAFSGPPRNARPDEIIAAAREEAKAVEAARPIFSREIARAIEEIAEAEPEISDLLRATVDGCTDVRKASTSSAYAWPRTEYTPALFVFDPARGRNPARIRIRRDGSVDRALLRETLREMGRARLDAERAYLAQEEAKETLRRENHSWTGDVAPTSAPGLYNYSWVGRKSVIQGRSLPLMKARALDEIAREIEAEEKGE